MSSSPTDPCPDSVTLNRQAGGATAEPERGVLDVVASAGVLSLDARAVVIAVREGRDWTVRGYAGTGSESTAGSHLEGVDRLEPGAVTRVAVRQPVDGVLRLTPQLTGGQGAAAGEPWGWVALGRASDGRGVLVLVVEPGREPSAATLQECLHDLRGAAADALVAERARERTQLRAGLHEREEERSRWARELHDETLQQLGALQVLLTSARRAGRTDRGDAADPLLRAVDLATELVSAQITSLRHLITELRPAALDELGLRAPLQALAQRTEALTGLRVEVHISLRYADGEVTTRLLPDIELAVYRVVQEALTNASRHSGAARARVSVIERDNQVWVEISDDGNGLTHEIGSGFGIPGMRERAALAGGRLEVLPAQGSDPERRGNATVGTLIRLVVPATHR